MGACATKPKAVNGTAPEVASTEQTAAPAEATRDVEAVVVVSFFFNFIYGLQHQIKGTS
jgi:hypothetical protein